MPLVVPRNVTFLAKSEYFTSPGIKGFIKKLTFIALGQVPIDRSGGKRSEAAILTGLRLLRENHCVGIYPEGTRSPDGRLYKGRTGIARMAIESGAPVIPVAMFNTAEIQPTGQVVPKVRRVEMVLRSATNQLMEKIAELSKQEYVPNMYASDAKDAIKKSLKERIDFDEDDV
jgi:1-acyl-sn-glycerol-3-phosphate acyltransferase